MRLALAVILALGLGMSGCSSFDKEDRIELAKAGIELAVQRIADVVVKELVDEGLTLGEAEKVAAILKRKASSIADRIWKKIEGGDDE